MLLVLKKCTQNCLTASWRSIQSIQHRAFTATWQIKPAFVSKSCFAAYKKYHDVKASIRWLNEKLWSSYGENARKVSYAMISNLYKIMYSYIYCKNIITNLHGLVFVPLSFTQSRDLARKRPRSTITDAECTEPLDRTEVSWILFDSTCIHSFLL